MDLQKILEEVKDLKTEFKATTVDGHELSNRNRLLLERQGGFEGWYGGYQQRKAKGFQVIKGQKGFKILVPNKKRNTKEKEDQEQGKIRFLFVTVFHQAQVKKSEEPQSRNAQ